MKVTCKCCHKVFDYDMYMGLCPKCGRVYRRGAGHYSAVEKDMMGDFHLHAEEGGLNRGIHGVVYNQGSTETGSTNLNGYDTNVVGTIAKAATGGQSGKATYNKPQPARYSKPITNSSVKSQYAPYASKASSGNMSQAFSSQATPKDVIETVKSSTGNGYYSTTHKTKLNQQVSRNGKQNSSIGLIVFIIIIIISILSSIFD